MKKLLCVLMFGQTELTTRVYTISLDLTGSSQFYNFDFYSLMGYELNGAKIEIFQVHDFSLDADLYEEIYGKEYIKPPKKSIIQKRIDEKEAKITNPL